MATAVLARSDTERLGKGRHFDNFFFSGMALMIVMGILAASNSLARGFAPPGSDLDPKTFYAIPIGDMLIFSTLVFFAFRARFNPSAHKRLILIATIALMWMHPLVGRPSL